MPEDTGAIQGLRGPSGRYRKGASGNPRGRPRGSRNRVTVLCQELLEGSGEEVVRKLVKLAKRGDRAALRLVMERLLPRARGEHEVDLAVPRLGRAADIVAAWAVVVEAAASGRVTLEEAGRFGAILEGHRKALETADLAARVEALERGEG